MNMDPQNEQLPQYFNSTEKWPGKIHEPLDQGNCAASWAFSTAGQSEIRRVYCSYVQNMWIKWEILHVDSLVLMVFMLSNLDC